MAGLKNMSDEPPTFVSQSPQGLAIRDPGVMSSSHSFTEGEFENRHTVDIGIGNAYGDIKLAGKGRDRRHHHHRHHHHRNGSHRSFDSQDGLEDSSRDRSGSRSSTRDSSRNGTRQATRRRSRTRSIRELDSDRPVTPPGERVIRILGDDRSTGDVGISAKPIFSEMEELLWENGDSVWRETARWIRFEEDVEESGNRFSKPHVGTLSLHALFELRSFLLNGALLFDVDGSTLDQISSIVVDRMICTGNLALKHRDKVKETILKRHRHAFEGEKKKDDEKKRDDDRRTIEGGTRSKSEPSFMKLPIIRSFGSRANFAADTQNESNLMNDPYMLGKGNIHFMKKVPHGAEACNILVGEVDFLENPVAAFIRLSSANELGDLTEVPVPTRFIFLLLGTVGNLSRYHEVGRAIGTLMSDEVFHEIAYKAAKREHIIAGIDEFLDAVTVLPPGEWDPSIRIEPPDHLPSQEGRKFRQTDACCPVEKVDEEEEEQKMREESGLVRSGKFFGGLRNDFKRKKPWYKSDYKDCLSAQCIASWLFLYFACLTPIVTFGGLLGAATGQRLAAIESLLSGLICGIGYGLFSGQPLTILGSTGPVLVFESILYEFCESVQWDYLSFRLWTGIWVGVILIVLVALDCSAFVCYITRFTEENFATLIAVIFMYEAIDKLLKIRLAYPVNPPVDGMNCFCKPPVNETLRELYEWSSVPQPNCTVFGGTLSEGCSYEPNVFFMSVLLFMLTVIITFKLKGFKESSFFPTIFRRFVSDFSVILAIVIMTVFDYLVKVKTPKLIVPDKFAPTWPGRTWLIPILNGNPWWTIIAAIIPALLATILIFMDQQITAVIVNRRENKLKKGCGYHLDLFVLAFLIVIVSVLGLPIFVAATVLSINHVSSLKLESETAAPGEKPQFLGVLEQRVTQLLIFLTIGISVFLVPVLKLIPMPVLYGIFLYMGASSLKGLQFVDRLLIILMPSKYQPDLPFLRKVPIKRVHLFTFVQLVCLVLLWVIKSVKQTKMLFPVMLVFLIGIRKLLDRYFSIQELKALDDILPDFKRKERDEEEDICFDENNDEESNDNDTKKPPISPDGQANLKIPMVSGNIMKISVPVEDPINISEEVKRCGVWKTVNSSNELVEKQGHKRHSKKSKRPSKEHHKSHKNPKLSEIEEESFLKASFDGNDDDDDDEDHTEFITIKIDKVPSSTSVTATEDTDRNDEEENAEVKV